MVDVASGVLCGSIPRCSLEYVSIRPVNETMRRSITNDFDVSGADLVGKLVTVGSVRLVFDTREEILELNRRCVDHVNLL